MPYLFINRYCKLTVNLPELGIVVITGWITHADVLTILIQDENENETLIKREYIVGSIVVLMEQKPLNDLQMLEERGVLIEK